ncbi:glycoside hydrolase family 140 protein [Paenibacillus sp.]|uniref:glycoside hydrolase family 140 protein n=1 Tax=Paenibacillus sp. TaxID=58172 RepID=UPI002D3706CA|nr:glycoside hydrolase family 140 protein [Paenibacillus sp.]HZG87451.1 glycoside hydrolase family 140 protein [Paenibacillus sp.]
MSVQKPWSRGRLTVSPNGRFLRHADGTPFFWLGDTAWLLLTRTKREEARAYFQDRRAKGYNVVQVMVIHRMPTENEYGRSPFHGADFASPDLERKGGEGSYWDYTDEVVAMAEEEGLYIALVPVWGDVVKHGALDEKHAALYGRWLAERYGNRPNVIWLIGGDIHGSTKTEVWRSLAKSIRDAAPRQLMTFHPFGRTQSSTWFHHEDWLDFNMFQSGHRRYDQLGDESPATWKGEDNWRYVQEDYAREPAKPTLDGEPSYEGIPQGLHDPNEPLWGAADSRRYAYWSVFAGACGHTYGHNAIMQLHKPEHGVGAYGCTKPWTEALDDPGGRQMAYLKRLMLSRPYEERIPDQTVIHGDPGYRYDRLLVTRGHSCLMAYMYTGRPFELRMGAISGTRVAGWWYNPRDGESLAIGEFDNEGIVGFTPPGGREEGNDWVLVLDDASKRYGKPGVANEA